jgi:hypothetical protein
MKRLVCLASMIMAFGLAASGTARAQNGSITGKVLYEGTAPTFKKIKMNADPVCKMAHSEAVYPESVVVNGNGTLRWVMVYVKEGVAGGFKPPAEPVVLDQVGCMYNPHVFGVMAGQDIEIRNSDEVLHNIHSLPETNKAFNLAQPLKGLTSKKAFDKPEMPIRIKCDVHPWMNCYAGVFSHPFYAVTGEDGSFAIKNLPPGDYVVETWHETLGTQTHKVAVAAGETKSLDVSYKAGS